MISPSVKKNGLQLIHLLSRFSDFFEKIGYLRSFFSSVGWPEVGRAAKEIKLWYAFSTGRRPFGFAIGKGIAEYVFMLRV